MYNLKVTSWLIDEFEARYSLFRLFKEILQGVSSIEARIYLEYIFQDSGKVSLSELSDKYNMPKSTIHNKIDEFKKKIFTTYMPDNEDDGIAFLKSLANSLDDLSK